MKKYLVWMLFSIMSMSLAAHGNNSDQDLEYLRDSLIVGKEDSTLVKNILQYSNLFSDGSNQKLLYIKQALSVAEKINWLEGQGQCHYRLGLYHLFNGDRDETIDEFTEATQCSKDPATLVYSYGCISNLFSWENNYEMALKYAQKGIEVAESTPSYLIKSDAWIYMGDVDRYNNNMQKAKYSYAKALAYLNKDSDTNNSLSKLVVYVYLTNHSIESPLKALKFAKETKALYDNATPQEKQLVAISLLKIAQAYTASAENEKAKQIELYSREKEKRIYIVGIALLFIIMTLLFLQNYSRKKANQALENVNKELERANEMRSRFFGILNHDLRRPVAGLFSYLQLKTLAPEMIDPTEAAQFEKKTIETAKQLLENMEELLFWCKDQMQSFTPESRPVLVSKLFDDTKIFFGYEKKTNFSFETPDDLVIVTDENYVKTIMRNLTSNSIQATENIPDGVIQWKAYSTDKEIILSISNNGEKLPQEIIDILYKDKCDRSINTGLGLKIVRDLAKTIGCTIKVQSSNNNVVFSLIFNKKTL